jgi:hypothetical protein
MAMTQIRGAQIRDREIVTGKLALASVIEEILGDSSVTNLKVANDAISTAKIADLNVTTGKLAAKAVAADKIGDAAITGGAQLAATVAADGKTFSGDVTFSSPLNVADAVDADHAVAKGQLDTAIQSVQTSIAALGNAFNYVGMLDGGADAASAFDLATLAEGGKDAGDYYKVQTSGYFKVGTSQAAFFANANDGLLFNTSGTVDRIDNTNSEVQGTVDFITVTGSTDTGFAVDIHETFKDRVDEAELAIGAVAGLTTTADDLAAAVNELDAEIGDLSALATDTKTTLVAAINELDARQVADTYVRETPAGNVDGLNAAFALANAPVASTVQVYVNGLLQEPTEDYSLSGQTVTFVAAPLTGDRVRAIYFKQA